MSDLSETLRQRSHDQAEHSAKLFEAEDFESNPKKQSLAIIGQVNATLLSALADLTDELLLAGKAAHGSESYQRRLAILKRNDAIRLAAAKGDWDEFDRLAAGGDPGSDGPSEVDAEA